LTTAVSQSTNGENHETITCRTVFVYDACDSKCGVGHRKSFLFMELHDAESEAEITGFEIYQLVGTLPEKAVISKIPATARFATGPITYDNAKVNRYYIRAYNNSNPEAIEFSGPSNTYRQHVAPGQFKRK